MKGQVDQKVGRFHFPFIFHLRSVRIVKNAAKSSVLELYCKLPSFGRGFDPHRPLQQNKLLNYRFTPLRLAAPFGSK
jgi:hypothetical protein